MQPYSLVIHGGAGTIIKEDMTPELEKAYINGLQDALNAGYAVLEEGGTATNAVKAAIVVLEDNLLFNAGRGSVFTKKACRKWMRPSWTEVIFMPAQLPGLEMFGIRSNWRLK